MIIPNPIAMPKLNIVPTRTYSAFTVLSSLNLKIDLAAIRKPTASNWFRIINVKTKCDNS